MTCLDPLGWNHLPGSSKASSFYWILVILMSLFAGGALLFMNVDEFLHTYVESTVNTTTGSLDLTKFPKIVICNSYDIRQSFWNAIFNSSSPSEDIKEAFTKQFLEGYHPHEEDLIKPKIEALNKIYNETVLPNLEKEIERTNNPNYERQMPSLRTKLMLARGQDLKSMVVKYRLQKI